MLSTDDGLPLALRDAFVRYERALMADDVAELDDLFASGVATIRSQAGVTLVGHEAIAAFRAGRGGAPSRTLQRVHVRALATNIVVVVAESVRADGWSGVQTQVWTLPEGGDWKVAVAHVSAAAPTAADVEEAGHGDAAIWRVPPTGAPLASGGAGPLAHATVAVKDLFAVAGQRVGAGNPTWLAHAPVESEHATAVAALLRAGADVHGIAHTDELAFSLSGNNIHYGSAANVAAPGRITGGSSSGSAAAVAAGLADVGLGTDTAGSIRVPASYCGLYGLRTTHGAVDRTGLLGLAPSFDTVGVLARTASMLRAAASALLPPDVTTEISSVIWIPELVRVAEPSVQQSFSAALGALTLRGAATGAVLDEPRAVPLPLPAGLDWDDILTAFRTVQVAEAWRMHGCFVEGHPDGLEPAIRERFLAGSSITPQREDACRKVLRQLRSALLEVLAPGTVLALPSTPTAAPLRDADPATVEAVRAATLRLTCLASAAGFPALSIPTMRDGELPVGLSLVAAPGEDHALLALAESNGGLR